ncbi:MAG: hypothetical protein AAF380_02875 [Bacteroidota bacterium]
MENKKIKKVKKMYWLLVALFGILVSHFVVEASHISYEGQRVWKIVQPLSFRKWHVINNKRRYTMIPYINRQYPIKKAIIAPIQRILRYRVHENTDQQYTHSQYAGTSALKWMLLCGGTSLFFKEIDELLPSGWSKRGQFCVCAESLESRKQPYTFHDLWKKSPTVFQEKNIVLLHEGEYIYNGFILKSYQDQKKYKQDHRIFKMNNGELVIQKLWNGSYELKLTEEKKSNFFKDIEEEQIKRGDELQIRKAKDSILGLPSGHYKVNKLATQVEGWIFYSVYNKVYNYVWGKSLDPLHIELLNTNTKDHYQLILRYVEDDYGRKIRYGVQFIPPNSQQTQDYQQGDMHFWDYSYEIVRKETTKLNINPEKIDSTIEFVTQNKESVLKKYEETVKKYKESVLDILLADEALVYKLCDQLIAGKKISVNYLEKIAGNPVITAWLNDIMEIYVKKLGDNRTTQQLLEEIIQESLFLVLAKKQKMSKVKELMDLLNASFGHTKKMKKNAIILLVGDTGSGKSTTANFLIGSELQITRDKEGRIDHVKVADEIEGPVIGANSTCSQTLYAQAFDIKDRSGFPMIVDCPGFGDSRKQAYRACAEISIDQAVMQAESVKSIVQVIATPDGCRYLFRKKGQCILNLMKGLATRFPTFFDSDSPDSALLHILLTQDNENPKRTLKDFKEGIKKLINQFKLSLNVPGTDKEKTERNICIAKCIEKLAEEGHVHCLDLSNNQKAQRNKLLELYSNSGAHSYNKNAYKSSLESVELHDLMSTLSVAIDTWQNLFVAYHRLLPEQIKEREKDIIQHKKTMKERSERENKTIQAQRNSLEEQKNILKRILKTLNNPNSAQEGKKKQMRF